MASASSRRWTTPVVTGLLLIGLFAAWYAVLPRLVLARMALAIEARDHEALSRHIDYPQLRESLRAELGAALHARAAGDRRAALGATVGEAMLGPVIDRVVTPDGVRELMQGGDALARIVPRDMLPEPARGPPEFRVRGHGLGEVHVVTETPSGSFRLVFARTAFGMKLVGVRLPAQP